MAAHTAAPDVYRSEMDSYTQQRTHVLLEDIIVCGVYNENRAVCGWFSERFLRHISVHVYITALLVLHLSHVTIR